jgi:hypothetical protein
MVLWHTMEKFTGVQNYIALIGKKSSSLEEQAGYYGEQLVLTAQQLGLNTCWVAMTVSKGTVKKHCVMQEHITKPINPDNLYKVLSKCIYDAEQTKLKNSSKSGS